MEWVSVVGKIVEFFLAVFKKKKAGHAFVDAIRLFELIDELINKRPDLKVERIAIMKAHNDNSDMTPVSFKYITAMYSKSRSPMKEIGGRFIKVEMDEDYYLILAEMFMKKGIDIYVDRIPSGPTKSIYKAEGIRFQKMFFIKHTKKALWYCSFSTSAEGETLNSDYQRTEIFMAVNKIRNLLKAY
jgi:hypothetical protein